MSGRATDGRDVVLSYRSAGDLIGEIAVLDGGPRTATVTAATQVYALGYTRAQFLAFLAEHPEAERVVRSSVSRKFREATLHRVELTGASVLARIAHVLHYLGRSYGRPREDGSIEIGLPITQAEIAALVGAAESSVERAVAQLRAEGLVDSGYRHLVLLRPGELLAFGDGS